MRRVNLRIVSVKLPLLTGSPGVLEPCEDPSDRLENSNGVGALQHFPLRVSIQPKSSTINSLYVTFPFLYGHPHPARRTNGPDAAR